LNNYFPNEGFVNGDIDLFFLVGEIVITLTLGLQHRQGLTKVRAKNEAWESHFMLSGMQKSVRE
jgi:hypothetical protein